MLLLVLLTAGPGEWPLTKSPVELQRLPMPATVAGEPATLIPLTDAVRLAILGCLGDGDGAGDIEWLLIESECSDPFEWWIAFWAKLLAFEVDMLRDGELVTRDGTRPNRFSSTLEFNRVIVFREKRKLLLDMVELLVELASSVLLLS